MVKRILANEWYFIDSGVHTPSYNMALDEYLMEQGRRIGQAPVLRFYGWNPPGLSIGYFQKTKSRINQDALEKRGIAMVRRLTGGQAVLHHDELTYSIIISEHDPAMPHSVIGAYRVLSQGLLEGFHNLGLKAELAIPDQKKAADHSPVCFEEASWYELVVAGKKAAGSAQTRHQGMILQHGSIPLHTDSDELFACFQYPSAAIQQRAKRAFSDKAIAIDQAAGRKPSIDEVKQAFYHGFETGLGITFHSLQLSEADECAVEQLAREKYAADSWNYSR
ncbi:biotin/lipoate A/B protein ligase family protein [Sporolactobacillus spathodeae]